MTGKEMAGIYEGMILAGLMKAQLAVTITFIHVMMKHMALSTFEAILRVFLACDDWSANLEAFMTGQQEKTLEMPSWWCDSVDLELESEETASSVFKNWRSYSTPSTYLTLHYLSIELRLVPVHRNIPHHPKHTGREKIGQFMGR